MVRYLEKISSECGVIIAGLHLDVVRSAKDFELLVKHLEISNRIYASVLITDEEQLDWYVECLEKYSGKSDTFTRLAVIFPGRVLTPYFPVATSYTGLWGISVALRYAPDAARAVREGSLKPLASEVVRVERIARSLASKVGLDYLGVDLSLSPWMDESVARVIELLQGAPLGSPGTMWAVGRVNAMIRELAEEAGVEAIGYGEVMLSVLEDSLLSARVGEKRVRLRDLVSYSAACAVGVDMVAVPPTLDLRGLARDVWVVRGLKSGPVSVRLLFSEALPGSAVYVEGFGATFVIEP